MPLIATYYTHSASFQNNYDSLRLIGTHSGRLHLIPNSFHVNPCLSSLFHFIPCHSISFHLIALHLIRVCICVFVAGKCMCVIWTKWSDVYPLGKTAVVWQQFGKAYDVIRLTLKVLPISIGIHLYLEKYYKYVVSVTCLVWIAKVICEKVRVCVLHVKKYHLGYT